MNFPNMKTLSFDDVALKQLFINGVQAWTAGRLPSAYQEVEWIQAAKNVSTYLDLGFKFDTAARVKLGMYYIDTTNSHLFGAAENSGVLRCMISAPYGGKNYASAYGSDGSKYITNSVALVDGYNDIELLLKQGQMSFKNLTNGHSATDYTVQAAYTMTSNLYLFAQNYNGSMRCAGNRKVSYFQYYDKNDELICDLVSCYRKADGVIGMYDVVRKIFLINAGSISFTKGPDV